MKIVASINLLKHENEIESYFFSDSFVVRPPKCVQYLFLHIFAAMKNQPQNKDVIQQSITKLREVLLPLYGEREANNIVKILNLILQH